MIRKASPAGRIRLRNKIIECLLSKEWNLGCMVYPAAATIPGRKVEKKKLKFFHRLIIGTAKDGRAIFIYPVSSENIRDIPASIREILQKNHKMGALAGCAANIGDAFDIVFADETQYPRKRRTFLFEYDACRKKEP